MQFYVIKGDSANSFSVPGGHVYVNEPLLALANNRDELGGVLAHETGHMLLHHVLRRMRNASVANTIGTILSIPAQILLGPLASIGAGYAIDTVGNAQNANLSRHIEAQADEEGARIMAASNELNPYGMIWFFEVMTKKYGDRGTFWLSDHPFSSARIADLKALFASDPQTFGKFHDSKAADDVYW
jgi:predicted Zn-dependent protease